MQESSVLRRIKRTLGVRSGFGTNGCVLLSLALANFLDWLTLGNVIPLDQLVSTILYIQSGKGLGFCFSYFRPNASAVCVLVTPVGVRQRVDCGWS